MSAGHTEGKPFKNAIIDWQAVPGHTSGLVIVGKVRYQQDDAGVSSGEVIRTSTIIRTYRFNGEHWLETLNSIYLLEDGE